MVLGLAPLDKPDTKLEGTSNSPLSGIEKIKNEIVQQGEHYFSILICDSFILLTGMEMVSEEVSFITKKSP